MPQLPVQAPKPCLWDPPPAPQQQPGQLPCLPAQPSIPPQTLAPPADDQEHIPGMVRNTHKWQHTFRSNQLFASAASTKDIGTQDGSGVGRTPGTGSAAALGAVAGPSGAAGPAFPSAVAAVAAVCSHDMLLACLHLHTWSAHA